MGRQEDSRCRDEDDPVVEVTIADPFAGGVFEVTVDEWATCRREGGCSHNPRAPEPRRGDRPVTDVSWEDAQQYVRWLRDAGLGRFGHLSPTRHVGVYAIVMRMQQIAAVILASADRLRNRQPGRAARR